VARWAYSAELLEALARFGLAPGPETPPRLVRDQLNEERLLAGEFPKADYVGHVVALRKKYWPLSFTPGQWESVLVGTGGTEGDGVHGGDAS
jgi:hypothetical protein